MTPEQIQAIKDRWDKATPGPWHWDVNKSCKFVSLESNGHVVMGFKRYGMGGAQPTFLGEYALEPAEMLAVPRKANHPNFDMDINHPNAQAIASAPSDIADLLAFINQQAENIEKLKCGLNTMVELCDHAADFRNGNVDSGMDEGSVLAYRIIDGEIRPLLKDGESKEGLK